MNPTKCDNRSSCIRREQRKNTEHQRKMFKTTSTMWEGQVASEGGKLTPAGHLVQIKFHLRQLSLSPCSISRNGENRARIIIGSMSVITVQSWVTNVTHWCAKPNFSRYFTLQICWLWKGPGRRCTPSEVLVISGWGQELVQSNTYCFMLAIND